MPERFARRSNRRLGGAGLLRPILVVGVIVAIVAAVAAWQLSGSSGAKQDTPPTTSHPTTTAPAHTTAKKHHHEQKHVPAVLPSRAKLVASRGLTWLELRYGSQSGQLIWEGDLAQGQTRDVSLNHGPVWIRIGYPPALDIRLGGKLVHGLPRQVGNVVLTRRGLKAA